MKNEKAVLSVKFNSIYNAKELNELFHKHLQLFKDMPGLIEKYYLSEDNTNAIGGIYIFESKTARDAFWNSELAKDIPGTYGVILDTLRVENFEVTIDMNESVLA
jgi:hypothetical protein